MSLPLKLQRNLDTIRVLLYNETLKILIDSSSIDNFRKKHYSIEKLL